MKKTVQKQPIIEIDHVSKVYVTGDIETKALDNVSFTIRKGEFVAIMGPSGSGKSTLMHLVGALDLPTSGSYILDGQKVADMSGDQLASVRNAKIGFIFQAFNLLPRTTALKNVMLPMMYAGIDQKQREQTAIQYLTMVSLSDRIHYTSSQLSGGQQQRVAIARGLVMNPSLLLADEPTGNIASSQAAEVLDIFERVHKAGHTIMMITHEPEIAAYAERVITIKDGKIVSDAKRKSKK